MVDSTLLSTVQDYFPQAEIAKPQQGLLVVTLHVGNVTEKFGSQVYQKMLQDHAQEVQLGFAVAGYTRLIVVFNDFSCLWDTRKSGQFGCADDGSPGTGVRLYDVYPNARSAPNTRCAPCPVCGRGGDERLERQEP
jgi:hypothetical protein